MDCIFAIHQSNLTKTLAIACKTLQDIFTEFRTETNPERAWARKCAPQQQGQESIQNVSNGREKRTASVDARENILPVYNSGRTQRQRVRAGKHTGCV